MIVMCLRKPSDIVYFLFFFFSSRRRHTRSLRDWSSDVCSSDLGVAVKNADLRAKMHAAGKRCLIAAQAAVPEDRKSTRLNSSHVEISYAVFCLKKKTRPESPSSTSPQAAPVTR